MKEREREKMSLETRHKIRQQESYMTTRQKLFPLWGEHVYNIKN
jgi:hypothetical protein